MTTFQRTSIQSDIFDLEQIPKRTLTYFRARLSNRMHALILEEFAKQEQDQKITKAALGRKISREPAQITRWLGSAGNLTLDTVSDLLLGMGLEPAIGVTSLAQQADDSDNAYTITDLTPRIGNKSAAVPDDGFYEPESGSVFAQKVA